MRKALSTLAAKSVYSAHVLPTILYCSTPALQIADTMTQKFEKLQEKALKIIYCQANQNREIRFGSILNQKKSKAACLIFKCLQGTSIPAFHPTQRKFVTTIEQEIITNLCVCRYLGLKQQEDHSGFKDLTVTMNFPWKFAP